MASSPRPARTARESFMAPEVQPPRPIKTPRRGLTIVGVVLCGVLAVVVVNGVWSRNSNDMRLRELADGAAVPTVAVVSPVQSANKSSLDLPGRLEAYTRAP